MAVLVQAALYQNCRASSTVYEKNSENNIVIGIWYEEKLLASTKNLMVGSPLYIPTHMISNAIHFGTKIENFFYQTLVRTHNEVLY